jgi:hypothetical protein
MTLAHTSVALAGVLHIVSNPWSAQISFLFLQEQIKDIIIRGAVSVHQASLTLSAYLHVGRAGVGEKVGCSAVQWCCTQYAGTGGRVRSAGIKNETPWAMGWDSVAGVQTVRNRTVGVREMGEDEDRGSGKY